MKAVCNLFLQTFLILLLGAVEGYAQGQRYKGYPDRSPDMDVLPGFTNPPAGYGNVPFYWWNGDPLDRERMAGQLDILSESATDGFAVSYIHTTPRVDSLENRDGHGLFGRTEPGSPGVFTDEWWEFWNWFSAESAKRGMGAGVDDYTMGWHGNGYYPDELDSEPLFQGYKGRLEIKTDTVRAGETYESPVPAELLAVVAWPGKTDLTSSVENGKLRWRAPDQGDGYTVYTITTKPGYLIHPEHGNKLVDVYFDRFEERMDEAGREGMNYFFQDELSYPIDMLTWSDDFREEFLARKGYDIIPCLPALKFDIGPVTPKIRLDYCEVLTDLAEERYFRPVYEWNASRGLLYGCDNLGRGLNPVSYVDYFRMTSWFTAPGNDAPARGSSFIQTKVSSSISHLYNRPRTWLEAFHSMGWGSSGEWLTSQIDHHFLAGGNLVCMHGLYYSTHGGWWEWAPPDFHFRMPYWPHMKQWLKYTERMSYLLSQGRHVCDIALLYPTEPLQAYPGMKPDGVFDLARGLSGSGNDYDFVDFRSLREGKIEGGVLNLSDEEYKIVVLADMRAIHHSSLEKIAAFYRSGGIVLATGELPRATDLKGEGDPGVDLLVKEIFGLSAAELEAGKRAVRQTNDAGGTGWYIPDSPEKHIAELITPDFAPQHGEGKVLHRKIGARDVYMVADVEKGSECFFRSTGRVELWDAVTGTTRAFPVLRQTDRGTWLRMDREKSTSCLIVFSPGEPETETTGALLAEETGRIPLDGDWEVELLPTMNNKWGDYRLPASEGMIGAEARTFRYAPAVKGPSVWTSGDFDDSSWSEGVYGYGPQAETKTDGTDWSPVSFSWRYGVWDNPGGQGYHGLKGKIDERFFILDKGDNRRFRTFVYAPEKGSYRMESVGTAPGRVTIDGRTPEGNTVRLKKGWHSLEVLYPGSENTDYRFRTGMFADDRKRGFVVLYPADKPLPERPGLYSGILSSRWDGSGQLLYDPYGGEYGRWNFRFESVPGMEAMTLAVYGAEPRIWFDGEEAGRQNIQFIRSEGELNRYRVVFPGGKQRTGTIALSLKSARGHQGSAVIAEPVRFETSAGLMSAGDWSAEGALLHYSGGMYYRKGFSLPPDVKREKVMLDLGDVVASCEVKINGRAVGISMSPPYLFDITPYVRSGNNEVEVLVYSTLSNHYQTIPTPYRGDPKAGLLGPVQIVCY